jgi:endoglucanase
MKTTIIFLFFGFLFQDNFAQINGTASLVSGGRTRTFAYHLPTGSPVCNLPLIIGFHGDGGNGAGFQSYAGFDALANTENFIVVYPDAQLTGGSLQFNKYADTAPGFGTTGDPGFGGIGDPNAPDDVLFTSDLIDYFSSIYKINRNKVYATGHSGGGFMCYFLSVALANKITAIAPVAGSLWINNAYAINRFSSPNFVRIPIIHLHSQGDPVVESPNAANSLWPVSQFASSSSCNNPYSPTTTVINVNADLLTFCNMGKKVVFIKTKDATHSWPSAVNPQQEIWNFVKNYSLTAYPTSNCTNTNQSAQTGNWTSTPTWVGATIPISTNYVTIQSTHIVTLPVSPQIINGLYLRGKIILPSGGSLKIGN